MKEGVTYFELPTSKVWDLFSQSITDHPDRTHAEGIRHLAMLH